MEKFSADKIIVIVTLAIVMFMEFVDISIINTAIPSIANSIGSSPIDLKFAVTSYVLALSIFIPISGWLADRYGTQKIFMFAIVLFSIGSICCGFSNSLLTLTLFRGIQGIGGSLMTPVGRIIMVRTFPPEELVKASLYIFVPALLGPLLGPLLGGFFATYLGWRWIFFVNIPIGLVALFATYKWFENEKNLHTSRLDYWGFLFCGASLFCLTFSLEASIEKVFAWQQAALLLGGIVFLFLFIYRSLLLKEKAILNIYVFKVRTFKLAVIGNFINMLVYGGMGFLLPLFFQLQFGMSPLKSGLLVAPSALGTIVMRFYVIKLLKKFGFRAVISLAPIGLFIGFLMMARVGVNTSLFYIAGVGFLLGSFGILLGGSNGPLAYVDMPRSQSGSATCIDVTIRQFSASLSIAFIAFLLVGLTHALGVNGLGDPKGGEVVFHIVLYILAFVSLAQIPVGLFLKANDGAVAANRKL